MQFRAILAGLGAVLAMPGSVLGATFTSYTDQASFRTQLDKSYMFIDFAGFAGSAVPGDADFLSLGLDVIAADPRGLTPQSRVFYPGSMSATLWASNIRIMFNGSSTVSRDDDFAVNFVGGANGFGYVGNLVDGGVIEFYDGKNLTGNLIGTVTNDGSGGFFGGVSDMMFKSARITCDFNGDYTCGIADLQFGTLSTAVTAVPLPAAGFLLLTSCAGLACASRRRSSKTS